MNLSEPLSPLFADLNFFPSAEKTLGIVQASPPPIIPSPPPKVTPPSASQPGSQEEQIEALHGLDDPVASQDPKGEETEGSERTPEPTGSDAEPLSKLLSPGSGSSSKKRGKQGVSKKKNKKESLTGGEETEESPIEPLSPSSPTLTS